MCAASDPPVYLPPDAGIVPKLFFYGTINHCSQQQQQQKYNRNSFSLLSYFRPKQNFKSVWQRLRLRRRRLFCGGLCVCVVLCYSTGVDASLQPPPPY